MAIGMARRNALWFGTLQHSEWFASPNSGADSSPTGWNSDGSLLNGGGYVFNSWGSHKQYVFEWPSTSAPVVAQKLKSFADGSYGRGLLYFHTPSTYKTNVFPAALADPGMGLGYEGASLVYGVEPTGTPTTMGPNQLPVMTANYDLASVTPGFRGTSEAIYVPIPEGYTLLLGAFYSSTGTGRVFYTQQLDTGAQGTSAALTPLASGASNIAPDAVSGIPGVWIWVGRASAVASTVSLNAMIGRLIPSTEYASGHPNLARLRQGPWVGGQGNSGCRFVGKPTYIENHLDGIGFACTLSEVGFWANG